MPLLPILIIIIILIVSFESGGWEALTAVGTIGVALLAIWGEWITEFLAGPKINIKLRNIEGNPTTRTNGIKTIYYHLSVVNERNWSLAKRVNIFCTTILRKFPNKEFLREPIIRSMPLEWSYSEIYGGAYRNIKTEDLCNLGFLDEKSGRFEINLLFCPNNVNKFIIPQEIVRLEFMAEGDNFSQKIPYYLEIVWDGEWIFDGEKMRDHLKIMEIQNLNQ